jgi:LmbE family N-acetylglucosaminyl deacetylase
MVVVAHADDAEWGCAGTVAKWCAEGWEVVYVLCTDGSKGSEDPEMTSGRLVEIRKQEQLDAGKVLGLKDIVFLGYEDSMLEPTLELRRDIAREIRRHRPDVLICMNPVRSVDGEGYLGHPDHFASGEAALSAVFPSSRDRLTFPELLREGLEPHKVKEVWMMFHGDTADKFVDVSAYMDTAVDALKAHQTQVSEEDAEVDMRQWRNSTGKKVGFEFAEAFKVFQLE